jgi:peptidoglycan L-alanyl-D-glutamate endopeptidase CwlK
MSAGIDYHGTVPTHDLNFLAPRFREAVEAAIAECNDSTNHLEAFVYETYRSAELAQIYYARGRTVKPPATPVTNASTNVYSWHGFGLAVDVIHKTKTWNVPNQWFAQVAEIFKQHGCKWGGDWTKPDQPHFQWGLCKPSPSDEAREMLRTQGIQAVWETLGASAV